MTQDAGSTVYRPAPPPALETDGPRSESHHLEESADNGKVLEHVDALVYSDVKEKRRGDHEGRQGPGPPSDLIPEDQRDPSQSLDEDGSGA